MLERFIVNNPHILFHVRNDHEAASGSTSFTTRLKIVLEELIDELSKVPFDDEVPTAISDEPAAKKAKSSRKTKLKERAIVVQPSDLDVTPTFKQIPTEETDNALETTDDPGEVLVKTELLEESNDDGNDYEAENPDDGAEESFTEPGPSMSGETSENVDDKGKS